MALDRFTSLENKLRREIAARQMAEQLLEDKSRELYNSNQELQRRNQKIAEQSRDLQRQVVELQQTRQQLVQSEKMAVIGQMAAGVAHEINTPVGFVASNLDSLKDYLGALSELVIGQKQYLDKIPRPGCHGRDREISRLQQQADQMDLNSLLPDIEQLICDCSEGAERIRQIVADLSDFIYLKPSAVAAKSPTAPENINRLLKKAIKIASSEIKPKADVELRLGDLPPVICNGGKIGQVFLNLLVNAAQAIPEWGWIRVVTGEENNRVWIEISDNGCGIAEAHRMKIFDPFFTTKAIGQGTGLGLHVVKGAVEMHGGEISVSSREGFGACFRVSLPVTGKSENIVSV